MRSNHELQENSESQAPASAQNANRAKPTLRRESRGGSSGGGSNPPSTSAGVSGRDAGQKRGNKNSTNCPICRNIVGINWISATMGRPTQPHMVWHLAEGKRCDGSGQVPSFRGKRGGKVAARSNATPVGQRHPSSGAIVAGMGPKVQSGETLSNNTPDLSTYAKAIAYVNSIEARGERLKQSAAFDLDDDELSSPRDADSVSVREHPKSSQSLPKRPTDRRHSVSSVSDTTDQSSTTAPAQDQATDDSSGIPTGETVDEDPGLSELSQRVERELLDFLMMQAHHKLRTWELERSLIFQAKVWLMKTHKIENATLQRQYIIPAVAKVMVETESEKYVNNYLADHQGDYDHANVVARGHVDRRWRLRDVAGIAAAGGLAAGYWMFWGNGGDKVAVKLALGAASFAIKHPVATLSAYAATMAGINYTIWHRRGFEVARKP